jgi:copper chaperone
MKTAILKVEGMHCDGCATTIKTVLEREPGVQMAAVSFAEGQARVLYDPRPLRIAWWPRSRNPVSGS